MWLIEMDRALLPNWKERPAAAAAQVRPYNSQMADKMYQNNGPTQVLLPPADC